MDKSIQITSVDVTLHKYNHFDNRLWVEIKNNLDYMEVNEDSVIVSASQIISLLENLYMPMINKVRSVGSDFQRSEPEPSRSRGLGRRRVCQPELSMRRVNDFPI